MEGNICLWHIQQLQPLVLDPKRPGREGGLSEAIQPRCHQNIYRLHKRVKLILLQLTCRTSHWYRQSRFVVPPQCWEHGSPPPLGQTQLLDNGSPRLVKLVGHTGGSHKELSMTPLVTHGGVKQVGHRSWTRTGWSVILLVTKMGHSGGRWVNPLTWHKRLISSFSQGPTHLFQVECVLGSSPDKEFRWNKFDSTSIHMCRAR